MSTVIHLHAVFSAIKRLAPDPVPAFHERGASSGYNNRLLVNTKHVVAGPVWKASNIGFCNGWILPQHLIKMKIVGELL